MRLGMLLSDRKGVVVVTTPREAIVPRAKTVPMLATSENRMVLVVVPARVVEAASNDPVRIMVPWGADQLIGAPLE